MEVGNYFGGLKLKGNIILKRPKEIKYEEKGTIRLTEVDNP